ncbi:hypothetical protein [Ponticaulis sp.]|uniref:hypothetical protein n=1 Tax=Ponticaulis sp. TaxID=2020902 RepID=UPI00263213EE|nr:hypothetical protein [Ponticaulis sp.]MDF1679537.1 hypothetical protein [Ponticaulis sp.]
MNLSENTPSDLLARIMTYIGAAFRFQSSWALPASAGEPPRLLAFERRALSRMVSRAEHMIRCWIILLAFAHIRDDTAPTRQWTLPLSIQAGKRRPISFAEREILARRKPEPPAFRVSLPPINETSRWAFERQRTGHPKRRSEQIEAALDMRLKRLFTLLDEADDRARNIASIWKGRIRSIRKAPPIRRPHFDPLRGAGAPGTLLETAEEDEARTVRQFHLIAHTAVQGVYALCGRQCS